MKGLVFFVDLSKLLLPVIFDDIIDVDKSSLKEGSGLVRVGVVAHFDLLALNFYLLDFRVFYFRFLVRS